MKKLVFVLLLAMVLINLFVVTSVRAHCEIPCGIYGDKMRFEMMREHIQTIEKSMKEINKLSGQEKKNYNQLVRWINNKETHANYFMEIVTQYFMTQRIKPAKDTDSPEYKKYVQKITLLHKMLISAMKTKQTTDLSHTKKLRELVDEFEKAYFHKH